jgi:uncharacterized repeat protein (TIGR01451 family)
MKLQVPPYMHYLSYHVQFFSSEWPEFIGTKYNDRLSITVDSPSKGTSEFIFDVNNGYFVLDSIDIPGTGFDLFAPSGNPELVDLVDRIPRTPGADAGASDLIPIGGTEHPVSPNEQIIVKIKIEDVGDNMFDSAAYIDNMRFTGYAITDIVAKKEALDLNGGEVQCNDTIQYRVTLSNTGSADQANNPGDEFEDYLPDNVTYVDNSSHANYGTITYTPGLNLITWDGDIPAETSRVLTFEVTVNDNLPNGAIISNQGTVYWDSDESGDNDAIELTDDIYVDDNMDQDMDGETNDDDPTNITIYAFDQPPMVMEEFSSDVTGSIAYQYYLSRKWFETEELDSYGSCFEVAPSYHYTTAKSFKTKIRQSDGPQHWNYYFSNLGAKVDWWEIYFTCGDTSEDYELNLTFQDEYDQEVAKIRIKYAEEGDKPMDWLLDLSFWDPDNGWTRLKSDFYQGYLRNEWYKLRIEKNGTGLIDYSLGRRYREYIDYETGSQLSAPFKDLTKIKWESTTSPDPAICPLFFWDEHKIGLNYDY